ncbi:gamma-glutamyltransferase family protein [Deinococcus yavapaiensis]|uniref:Gamma-glutamyltransferase 2 n=1 Tax=Deinococcus yavapaiensis KR-236 TaxID=694435 RepID=A0A318SE36_9DEIO|nr:gamma-glutamyltransferase family protein [Deinococcus yavapaiensis]PYE54782.1 gamma-glutamyltransferase 2 [Deinococcus yavapaiensis KR-236]
MVATSQPLAAQAGLYVLREGGNAVDAAIATAATLTVVEPTSNGIGADAFALVWHGGELHGLNGSGRSPALLSRDALSEGKLPTRGWLPVTVPGAPRAWADLHARFGRLPFERVLGPAISYARNGYPLSPVLARYWKRAVQIYRAANDPLLQSFFETFAPANFDPRPGAFWSSEGHARTLERIAKSGAADFYEGELAERIDRFARETGGLLRASDLASHASEWVKPISVEYDGHEVHEIPPNGQGIAALVALGILGKLGEARDDVEFVHRQIEAMKLGFVDAHRYVADPRVVDVPTAALLEPAYHARRAELISDTALDPAAGEPNPGGTVYLCTADGEGGMVSFIQSNYMGFGSGLVVPGTGIALQNRGHNFSLEAGHPNEIAPSKRPYHTIIPGFLTREGEAVGPFGVMGGFMQPQGHLQVVVNTLRHAMDAQDALDAPRWQWTGGRTVEVEHEVGATLARALAARGHDVRVNLEPGAFGRGQIIWRDPGTGVLQGGTESRADGVVAAY